MIEGIRTVTVIFIRVIGFVTQLHRHEYWILVSLLY